jgi:GDP/UDP-N,N'-diacetylbacillosamine 2-epimerase (hydrolysing)
MSRKVCIVTGSRAEYGLLRGVIEGVRDAAELTLQLAVTGMHLSPEFGLTYREIEADGFAIDERIEMLLSTDTAAGTTKSTGLGLIGFADAFDRLKPDLVVLLGDRFEILAAAMAALFAGIPIAHIHGGETTEGAFDEAIRHSITKMAHLHFVAAESYGRRVIQLGEAPQRVFLVGALGVDAIRHVDLLDRTALEESLGFSLGKKSLLVTFHPPTLEPGEAGTQMNALLAALDSLDPDMRLIFTLPNADTGGREVIRIIEEFVADHTNARAYASLGQRRYFSCLSQVDGVVGNSSSGLIEAPSFGTGAVNIGDRQAGRLRGASVIDCAPQQEAIEAALAKLLSSEFRNMLKSVQNPYDQGAAAEAIVRVLRTHSLEGIVKKRFYDLALGGVLT